MQLCRYEQVSTLRDNCTAGLSASFLDSSELAALVNDLIVDLRPCKWPDHQLQLVWSQSYACMNHSTYVLLLQLQCLLHVTVYRNAT